MTTIDTPTAIQQRFLEIKQKLPSSVSLIVVSKTQTIDKILEIYNLGHRAFGENKVQELMQKYEALPKDIQWHLIGHLQTNKVKYIAPFVAVIHSVDSLKLLAEVDKQAQKNQRIIPILLQIHIAKETTKFGFEQQEILHLFENKAFEHFKNVSINGLMGMATFTNNQEEVKKEFTTLSNLFQIIKDKYFKHQENFNTLSMGMSNDYEIAIALGSTMIRIGSNIFGDRNIL